MQMCFKTAEQRLGFSDEQFKTNRSLEVQTQSSAAAGALRLLGPKYRVRAQSILLIDFTQPVVL